MWVKVAWWRDPKSNRRLKDGATFFLALLIPSSSWLYQQDFFLICVSLPKSQTSGAEQVRRKLSESLFNVWTFSTATIASVEKEILMTAFIVDKPSVNWSFKWLNGERLACCSLVTCVTAQKPPGAASAIDMWKIQPCSEASFPHGVDYWFRPGDEPNEVLKYFKCVKEEIISTYYFS